MKINGIIILLAAVALAGCSTTRNIPDDDQLFVGLKEIKYENYKNSDHFITTQEEVEADRKSVV